MYNYNEAITADILDYIRENYTEEEIAEQMTDRDTWEDCLRDDLWCVDGVTGNGSGSYYCDSYRAEEAIAHNWDLLNEALQEFGCLDSNPIEKGAEWCDVTIRCYLLGGCIAEALDELEAA